MLSLTTPSKAQKDLAANTRARRLQVGLTQEGLARRSGVPLPTLRKFEQKGAISLESFVKIQMALGGLDDILKATEVKEVPFSSINEVVKAYNVPPSRSKRWRNAPAVGESSRQRGQRK